VVAFRVETVLTGLEAPWEVAFAPDGRLFLTERPGRVRVVEGGQLRPEPAATLPAVAATGEGGLLGLALAPDFARSRALYLYHTYRGAGGALRNRVVRYREEGGRLAEERVILDGIPAAGIHDGGRLAFGPDGKLYVTTGDASSPDTAQDRGSLGGKILRLEPDGAIPADNPFPGSPVYSYGHRNPEGLAWQEGAGQLYATEHGSSAHDEVNRIAAGANYGWPAARGNDGQREGFVPPVIESGADVTWAPSGATFVRAATFPQWRGSLLFAALRGQALWRLALEGAGAPRLEAIVRNDYGRLRTVVEGPDGLLYLLTSNRDGRGTPASGDDRLLRLVPA
jgi:glucose/arabinose dehydrogenase